MQARLRHRRSVSRGLSRPRRLLRGIWVVTLAVSVGSTMSQAALAAGSPSPVIPSQAQVDAAKTAVTSQQSQVAQLEAGYQAASAEAATRQHAVNRAAAAYAVAEANVARAAEASRIAQADADRAAVAARAAHDALGRTAAAAYEQNGSTGELLLGLLGSEGPQRAVDLAQYLEDAAGALDRQLRDATMLAGVADSATAVAQERSRVLAEAAAAQADSLASMQAELDAATGALNDLAARQRAMVTELAALQNTSEDIQQERLDGLAAVAAAKAAEQAAAEQAAREAAARAAAAAAAAAAATPSPTTAKPSTTTAKPSPSTTKPTTSSASSTSPTSSSSPSTSVPPKTTDPQILWAQKNPKTVAQQLMPKFGFASSEWTCLESLWQKESSWYWAADNPYSSAYGIPQALPGTKMATAGADWLINPTTQITWGLGYIKGRYGTPCSAWAMWQSRSPHWY